MSKISETPPISRSGSLSADEASGAIEAVEAEAIEVGNGARSEPHHGTITSYVVGFVLSLLFTLIPYYLVVHQSLSTNALLATILGFGVLQMIVQVVFFLHLGREKKPRWNLFFLSSTIGIILVVVVGSLWIMSHLSHNMTGVEVTDKIAVSEAVYQVNGKQAGTCAGRAGVDHKIMLMDGVASPHHIDAHLCDTLTFMNHDDAVHKITFGLPDKTEMYAGETGTSVRSGRSVVILLTELGTHKFHAQEAGDMSGDFTVTE